MDTITLTVNMTPRALYDLVDFIINNQGPIGNAFADLEGPDLRALVNACYVAAGTYIHNNNCAINLQIHTITEN